MNETRFEITEQQQEQLRNRAKDSQAQLDQAYQSEPWRDAAVDYFNAQRQAGHEEMQTLMELLGLQTPLTQSEVEGLVKLAVQCFLGLEPGDARLSEQATGVACLEVNDCPSYRRVLGEQGGITACNCFSRRAGWYEALQRPVRDDPEANRKWGDERCRVMIHFEEDSAT